MMQVAPPFEQTLITHTQGLLYAISKNSVEKFKYGEEDFKGLVNRNQSFAFFHIQSSAKMPVGGVLP